MNGAKLESFAAAISEGDEREALKDGYFHESEYRSAPYFDLTIDGVTLLNTAVQKYINLYGKTTSQNCL